MATDVHLEPLDSALIGVGLAVFDVGLIHMITMGHLRVQENRKELHKQLMICAVPAIDGQATTRYTIHFTRGEKTIAGTAQSFEVSLSLAIERV